MVDRPQDLPAPDRHAAGEGVDLQPLKKIGEREGVEVSAERACHVWREFDTKPPGAADLTFPGAGRPKAENKARGEGALSNLAVASLASWA